MAVSFFIRIFGRYFGVLCPVATKATKNKNNNINAFQMELRTTNIRQNRGG